MNEWAGVFLGIMALTAVVQCAFVVAAALSVRSSGERINELCHRFDAEIKPTLDDLRKSASNFRAISDSGRVQAVRIEALISTTLENLETTIESVRSLILKPIASIAELSAFWGGLRRGLDTFRSGGEPKRRPASSPSRRSEDSDEHLFIG